MEFAKTVVKRCLSTIKIPADEFFAWLTASSAVPLTCGDVVGNCAEPKFACDSAHTFPGHHMSEVGALMSVVLH